MCKLGREDGLVFLHSQSEEGVGEAVNDLVFLLGHILAGGLEGDRIARIKAVGGVVQFLPFSSEGAESHGKLEEIFVRSHNGAVFDEAAEYLEQTE